MTQTLAASVLILAVLIASVLGFKWRERQQKSQCLAEALIGEIVAILETIETQSLVDALQDSAIANHSERATHRGFALPRLTVYEANAARLDYLGKPVQRLISQLFDRLAALPIEVASLDATRSPQLLDDNGATARVLGSVNQSLRLADEALLALRSIATPQSQARHLS
jgi:hypothetical protein